MTAIPSGQIAAEQPRARSDHPPSSIGFDFGAALLSLWFLFGLFIDGWAHNHGRVDETFFTPWHAVLYSGYLAVGLYLTVTQFRNVGKGYAFMRALPKGYLPSLVGVLIFGVAGGLDFGWHEMFGFEASTEALLSPAHLFLASGSFLFVTGALRAAWHRQAQPTTWRSAFPLILTLLIVTSLITFFVQYAAASNMLALAGRRPSNAWFYDFRGAAGILIHGLILLGMLLIAARRWRLPFGAFTAIFAGNALLMTWLNIDYNIEFLMAFGFGAAGFVADVLLWRWQPIYEQPLRLRWLAFLVAFTFGLATLGMLQIIGMMVLERGLWWKIHMWLGVPFTAGIAGYFLSFVALPPAIPHDVE